MAKPKPKQIKPVSKGSELAALRPDFNFVENLLAFCTHKSRSVPEESGVHFHIDPAIQQQGLCLLFHIDRERDKLITEGLRPDYMVLFATPERCICTIIEMKGRDEKACEHAIEQITALRDRLRTEFAAHLPRRLVQRIRYQGILLAPTNCNLPLKRLEDTRRNGLTIFPIRFSHQAQLRDYVCKLNALDRDRYEHKNAERRPHQPDFDWLHELLIFGAVNGRKDDVFRKYRAQSHHERSGVYLNYEHPQKTPKGYVALSLCAESEAVAFSDGSLRTHADKALSSLGFTFHCNLFQSMDTQNR